jgi:hypothetical protein
MNNDKGKPEHTTRRLLVLGASQALGFFLGALLGRYLGLLLGFDAFAGGSGYSTSSMVGILLIGFGGGAGVQLARRWYIRRHGDPKV